MILTFLQRAMKSRALPQDFERLDLQHRGYIEVAELERMLQTFDGTQSSFRALGCNPSALPTYLCPSIFLAIYFHLSIHLSGYLAVYRYVCKHVCVCIYIYVDYG